MKLNEIDIIDGISREEFFLEYQPICNIYSGAVEGVEALLRWSSLKLGATMKPDVFIPFATKNNLMPVLGAHVIRLVCRQISILKTLPSGFFISFNVCPTQLVYKRFPEFLADCMAEFSVNPRQIRIEITERVNFEVTKQINKNIARMRRMGCRVILDDFGSGFMGFSKLALLEVDGLKIILDDFVSGSLSSEKSQAMLAAVVFMISELGMSLVVERIETHEQKIILSSFSGLLGQGYYFGRPQTLALGEEFPLKIKSF